MQKTAPDINKAVFDIKKASEEIGRDLAGYATKDAMQQLTLNWNSACKDGVLDFNTMAGDIDDVIENLKKLKIRLDTNSTANSRMRSALELAFDVPPFDDSDDQLAWLERIREIYPNIEPKEAFRLAEQEYLKHAGIHPDNYK